MEAQIDQALCANDKEKKKISFILPMLEKYARFWEIPILIDAPHGTILAPVDDGKLHIHFFCRPSEPNDGGSQYANMHTLNDVFGFSPPKADIKFVRNYLGNYTHPEGNDVAAAFVASKSGNAVISPEGDVICKVLPGNIYITFDIFHRNWDGRGLVFEQILDEAIPPALEGKGLEKIFARVARHQRRKFLHHKDGVRKKFIEFCAPLLLEKLEEIRQLLKEQRDAHEKLWQELSKLNFDIETLVGYAADLDLRSPVREERYGRDFDMILRMPKIKGLRVDSEFLRIYTNRIVRVFNGQECGFGEKIIRIPYKMDINNFRLYQGHYAPIYFEDGDIKGEYYPPHFGGSAGSTMPCLGSDLSSEVIKLYQDGDMPQIIQWCVIFLEEENSAPGLPSYPSYLETGPEKPIETAPFYASEEERNEEREKYIRAMQTFMERNSRDSTAKNIIGLTNLKAERQEKFADIRDSLKSAASLREYLERQALLRNVLLSEKFDSLAPEIINMEISGNLCLV